MWKYIFWEEHSHWTQVVTAAALVCTESPKNGSVTYEWVCPQLGIDWERAKASWPLTVELAPNWSGRDGVILSYVSLVSQPGSNGSSKPIQLYKHIWLNLVTKQNINT